MVFELDFLLLMLHYHALQSLYLLIIWCHILGVLRFTLLRKIIILNESIGTHTQHLIIYLILYGLIYLSIGHSLLLMALILSNHGLLLELEILPLLDDGIRETLVLI